MPQHHLVLLRVSDHIHGDIALGLEHDHLVVVEDDVGGRRIGLGGLAVEALLELLLQRERGVGIGRGGDGGVGRGGRGVRAGGVREVGGSVIFAENPAAVGCLEDEYGRDLGELGG